MCAKKVSIRRKPCKPKQKLKPDTATQRVGLPPGQGKAASRKRVLRGDRGQPGSRSVDSEHVGCGIGPRKVLVAKADEAEGSEGHAEGAKRTPSRRPALEVSPGSKNRCTRGEGRRETWEVLFSARADDAQPPARARVSAAGERDVGVRRRSVGAGEPTRGTLWSKGRTGIRNRTRERWQRHWAQFPSQRDSNG